MKFPAASIVPPAVGNGQYSIGGLLLGSAQTWSVLGVDGLDLPKVRSGDVARPLDAGEFAGLDYLSGRDLTVSLHSQFASDTAMRSALNLLEAQMLPPQDGVTESWLWFQRPGNPLFVCGVRPRQFRLKSERKLTSMHTAQPIVLLHATSAFVYGPTQAPSAAVGGIAAGYSFNAGFNLSFGGGGSVGIINITNTGVAPARAVYVFQGPLIVPTITNGSMPGNPFMSVNITLNAGDELVVDTDLDGPSCIYYPAGSTAGFSVLIDLVASSVPLMLQVGLNKLVFTSNDPAPTGGTCTVQWAPPYPIAI